MSDFSDWGAAMREGSEKAAEVVGRLFEVTQPGSVYSEPIQGENYTVLTASEVMVGMGYGSGVGAGMGPSRAEEGETRPEEGEGMGGGGGGGGGGGYAFGRPVATVVLSADGVHVEPVVDVTKIALAFFTAIGAMGFMLARMISASKR